MRLIDADAAVDAVDKRIRQIGYEGNALALSIRQAVRDVKPADAVPVRHGRWEWDGEAFVCSACGSGYEGQPTMMGKPMFEFCPVCGADMRKDGDRNDND